MAVTVDLNTSYGNGLRCRDVAAPEGPISVPPDHAHLGWRHLAVTGRLQDNGDLLLRFFVNGAPRREDAFAGSGPATSAPGGFVLQELLALAANAGTTNWRWDSGTWIDPRTGLTITWLTGLPRRSPPPNATT